MLIFHINVKEHLKCGQLFYIYTPVKCLLNAYASRLLTSCYIVNCARMMPFTCVCSIPNTVSGIQ